MQVGREAGHFNPVRGWAGFGIIALRCRRCGAPGVLVKSLASLCLLSAARLWGIQFSSNILSLALNFLFMQLQTLENVLRGRYALCEVDTFPLEGHYAKKL